MLLSQHPAAVFIIGLLYNALPPECALQFRGAGPHTDTQMAYAEYAETTAGKLPNFLQWAVWARH
jgi:nuclear pore complex protein Nup205